jgi:hypothetical protein
LLADAYSGFLRRLRDTLGLLFKDTLGTTHNPETTIALVWDNSMRESCLVVLNCGYTLR